MALIDEIAFQIEMILQKAIMNRATVYDLRNGWMQTLKQILTLQPIEMTTDLRCSSSSISSSSWTSSTALSLRAHG